MTTIYDVLDVVESSPQKSVMATIIRVEGSAYLKTGTAMLFFEDGSQIGMISAGCAEADLAFKAQDVLNDGITRLLAYDLTSETETAWGNSPGCSGVLYILLEPVHERLKKQLCHMKKHLQNRKSVLHIKEISYDFHRPLIKHTFHVFDPAQENKENAGKLQHLIQSISQTSSYLYSHFYEPKPRLVIFGAGTDAKPLAALASQTGFFVTLCDWRPALCNKEQFPSADEVVIGYPDDIFQTLKLGYRDFVIVMTHQFQRDQEILSFLMKEKMIQYAGLLGSRERAHRLLQNEERPPFLHSPIGLSIGAIGPDEIAISILAEIIQFLRKPSKERVHPK